MSALVLGASTPVRLTALTVKQRFRTINAEAILAVVTGTFQGITRRAVDHVASIARVVGATVLAIKVQDIHAESTNVPLATILTESLTTAPDLKVKSVVKGVTVALAARAIHGLHHDAIHAFLAVVARVDMPA